MLSVFYLICYFAPILLKRSGLKGYLSGKKMVTFKALTTYVAVASIDFLFLLSVCLAHSQT